MMDCCQCQGIEKVFDEKVAAEDLAAYQEDGPDDSTQILLEMLQEAGVAGKSLLDIGGGVGAIQVELAAADVGPIVGVDASAAYLQLAREQATRRGYAERATYHHGNFVELAATLEKFDIVTLDRVICCYHDMNALVDLSLGHARQLYALVFPRDPWLIRTFFPPLFNFVYWLRRHPFRIFVHRTPAVEQLIHNHNFRRRAYRRNGMWQIALYERNGARLGTDAPGK